MRVSEALALQVADVTAGGLLIRTTKFQKSRLLPLHDTVAVAFRRLARSLGLRSRAGQPDARIHDLRHTFAVRSLEGCAPERQAVTRHLVALPTYLGHARVADTYWYLEATPVLLRGVAETGEALLSGAQA